MEKRFLEKEKYTEDDVKSLIENSYEESIHLEFKESGSLHNSDGKKKELAKDISSFANSDGGIIVFGIKEVNHVASSLSFIDGTVYTKEWLENVIDSGIYRKIPDVRIYPVRIDNDLKKTLYVVKIPASWDAPHMSRDKRYYKRYNFKSVHMEEYEIRALFHRNEETKLDLNGLQVGLKPSEDVIHSPETELEFEIEVYVENKGRVLENNYKIEMIFDNAFGCSLQSERKDGNNYWFTNERMHFTFSDLAPIFPTENSLVGKVTLKTKQYNVQELVKNVKLDVVLYTSCEVYEVDYSLGETIGKIFKEFSDKNLG